MTTTTEAERNAGLAPLAGPALWLTGFVLALSNFMVVLDMTITNVAVPNIAGGLAVSPDQGTWVITSYAVAEAISVPLTGWLAQRFGAVRVFSVAMFGFGICSMACGFAPSLSVLVMLRICQGLSGGPMMPLSQILLRRIFPLRLQPAALGLWGMTTVVAPVAGPLIGGALTDTVGWPWVFFINVPVALACAVFAWRALKSRETPTERHPIDAVGLGLLITWVGALQIMLDKGKDLDWFQSAFICDLGAIAAVGFASFVIWELTDPHPIVDLKVFRHRGFTASTIIMALSFGTFFATVVLIPLWLQTSMGYTATAAGRAMAVQGLLAIILSPIVAQLTAKVDSRLLVSFGVLVLAFVSAWRSLFTTDADFWHIAAPQVALGIAMAFFFVPLTGLALSSVLPREAASAAGLMNFVRTSSGAFGASIVTTAWETMTEGQRTNLVGVLNRPQATMDVMTKTGMTSEQARSMVDNMVQGQAVMLATDRVFQVAALVFVLGAAAAWISPKPQFTGAPPASGH
jgi:DHA2 family multidrug resistance protein